MENLSNYARKNRTTENRFTGKLSCSSVRKSSAFFDLLSKWILNFSGITEDRVRALEQRVDLQDDEIAVLKAALSDVLRRLKEVESASSYTSPRKPGPLKSMSLLFPYIV